MEKPIIGIMMRCSIDSDHKPYQYIYDRVRRSIVQSGGEPLLLCPVGDVDYYPTGWKELPEFSEEEKDSIDFWLSMCDGLFLPGGLKFTKYDKYVVNLAIEKNLPILGVCLGMQILANYNRDNELSLIESTTNHLQDEEDLYCHKVKIESNSLLYRIVQKSELEVNSFHKRTITNNISFKTTAYATDDVIEAIEMPSKDFVLGVQWHPEKMLDYDQDAMKIMYSFIEASRNYKKVKQSEVIGV